MKQIYVTKFRLKRFFIIAFAAYLSACTSSPSPVLPPVELSKLENEFKITRLWQKDIGDGVSDHYILLRPVVNADTGYVADYEGRLRAFEIKTGKVIWEQQLKAPIATEIAFAADRLIFGTSQGEVIVASAKDGAIIWRKELTSEVLARPGIAKGILVAKTVDGRVFGLDAESGEQRWVYDRTVPLLTLRGNSAPIISDDVVVTGSDNGKLSALILSSGKVLWESTVAVATGRNELERIVDLDADPVIHDDTVYAVAYQGRITALNLASGQIIWARDFSSFTGMHVDAYRVYITDAEGQIWALNKYNGSTLWRQDKLLRRSVTAPVVQNDYLIVGDYDGYLHWVNRSDGKLVARRKMNQSVLDDDVIDSETARIFSKSSNILVKPVVVNDLLLSYDRTGILEAYTIAQHE